MKTRLLLLFVVLTQTLMAQIFVEEPPFPAFEGVQFSSIAFSDVNGDAYEDVLITGQNNSIDQIAKLYLNDGTGNFTEMMNTPFDGVGVSSIAFSDVNGDTYEDVLITGRNNSLELIAKLYLNDGTGNFTEIINTPFEGVLDGSVAFSDVNGDGSNDVLITGGNSAEERITKLYINDGAGNFTEMMDMPFDGVQFGSVAFSDVNSDGKEDVLITGQNNAEERIAQLYINDGSGNFTEMMNTPFEGVLSSAVAFSDVNGDAYEDVFITGGNSFEERIAKLYTNDGTGTFTEMMNTPFDGVSAGSSVAFSDVNGDGKDDVLLAGANNSSTWIAKLYLNNGTGAFTELLNTPFDGVISSSIAFSDVNGDGSNDVLITGLNSSFDRIAKLYINDLRISTNVDETLRDYLDISLYPNPSKAANLRIRFDSTASDLLNMNIYDVNGRLLLQQQELVGIGEQTISIDIASLVAGSYFIELDGNEIKGIARFMVR